MALDIIKMQTTGTWPFLRGYLFLRLKQEHEKGTNPVFAKHSVGLPTKYIFVCIHVLYSVGSGMRDHVTKKLFNLEKECTYVSPDLR